MGKLLFCSLHYVINKCLPFSSMDNCNTVIVPPGRLYISRHQPPDVVIQHVNFNSNHDLYEELIM